MPVSCALFALTPAVGRIGVTSVISSRTAFKDDHHGGTDHGRIGHAQHIRVGRTKRSMARTMS